MTLATAALLILQETPASPWGLPGEPRLVEFGEQGRRLYAIVADRPDAILVYDAWGDGDEPVGRWEVGFAPERLSVSGGWLIAFSGTSGRIRAWPPGGADDPRDIDLPRRPVEWVGSSVGPASRAVVAWPEESGGDQLYRLLVIDPAYSAIREVEGLRAASPRHVIVYPRGRYLFVAPGHRVGPWYSRVPAVVVDIETPGFPWSPVFASSSGPDPAIHLGASAVQMSPWEDRFWAQGVEADRFFRPTGGRPVGPILSTPGLTLYAEAARGESYTVRDSLTGRPVATVDPPPLIGTEVWETISREGIVSVHSMGRDRRGIIYRLPLPQAALQGTFALDEVPPARIEVGDTLEYRPRFAAGGSGEIGFTVSGPEGARLEGETVRWEATLERAAAARFRPVLELRLLQGEEWIGVVRFPLHVDFPSFPTSGFAYRGVYPLPGSRIALLAQDGDECAVFQVPGGEILCRFAGAAGTDMVVGTADHVVAGSRNNIMLSCVEVASGRAASVRLPAAPVALTGRPGTEEIWAAVAHSPEGQEEPWKIVVVDAQRGEIEREIRIDLDPDHRITLHPGVRGLVVEPDGARAYVLRATSPARTCVLRMASRRARLEDDAQVGVTGLSRAGPVAWSSVYDERLAREAFSLPADRSGMIQPLGADSPMGVVVLPEAVDLYDLSSRRRIGSWSWRDPERMPAPDVSNAFPAGQGWVTGRWVVYPAGDRLYCLPLPVEPPRTAETRRTPAAQGPTPAPWGRIRALLEADRLEEAQRLVDNALREDPEGPALGYHAEILRRRGDLEAAIAEFERAGELVYDEDEDGSFVFYGQAQALGASGRWGDAASAARAALSYGDDRADVWAFLARARRQAGDLEGAVEAARQAYERDRSQLELVREMATALREASRAVCPDCDGIGTGGDDSPCVLCGGEGEVVRLRCPRCEGRNRIREEETILIDGYAVIVTRWRECPDCRGTGFRYERP